MAYSPSGISVGIAWDHSGMARYQWRHRGAVDNETSVKENAPLSSRAPRGHSARSGIGASVRRSSIIGTYHHQTQSYDNLVANRNDVAASMSWCRRILSKINVAAYARGGLVGLKKRGVRRRNQKTRGWRDITRVHHRAARRLHYGCASARIARGMRAAHRSHFLSSRGAARARKNAAYHHRRARRGCAQRGALLRGVMFCANAWRLMPHASTAFWRRIFARSGAARRGSIASAARVVAAC